MNKRIEMLQQYDSLLKGDEIGIDDIKLIDNKLLEVIGSDSLFQYREFNIYNVYNVINGQIYLNCCSNLNDVFEMHGSIDLKSTISSFFKSNLIIDDELIKQKESDY
jgi:hypothetical protein